ncbi:hypothetical protein [Sulfurimonas sp. HSL-1716]|uniref:hypothetical protein n=1 Tax=Hydrocurvibacter sulfurireducens TaxID=3131937 RepID=UPI0031F9D652
MFDTIQERLQFISGFIKEKKIQEENNDFPTSLYPYTDFSDTLTFAPMTTNAFHSYCNIYRDYADERTNNFLDKAYVIKRENDRYICGMRELHDTQEKAQRAEVQNLMSSMEAHADEFTLEPYMLTLTLTNEELKSKSSNVSFLEHATVVYDQVKILRYFMKLIYSDRLTKYKMPNFFWMRMLEFTKIGNAHLHEALYIKRDNLIDMIELIGRKWLDFPLVGRTHLTVDPRSWKEISRKLEYKRISTNEYLLVDYSHVKFFEKGHQDAGKGFIIRVLTKRKESNKQSKKAVSRYIMKYLLKTRSSEHTKASLQRAVFSFLRINHLVSNGEYCFH